MRKPSVGLRQLGVALCLLPLVYALLFCFGWLFPLFPWGVGLAALGWLFALADRAD